MPPLSPTSRLSVELLPRNFSRSFHSGGCLRRGGGASPVQLIKPPKMAKVAVKQLVVPVPHTRWGGNQYGRRRDEVGDVMGASFGWVRRGGEVDGTCPVDLSCALDDVGTSKPECAQRVESTPCHEYTRRER